MNRREQEGCFFACTLELKYTCLTQVKEFVCEVTRMCSDCLPYFFQLLWNMGSFTDILNLKYICIQMFFKVCLTHCSCYSLVKCFSIASVWTLLWLIINGFSGCMCNMVFFVVFRSLTVQRDRCSPCVIYLCLYLLNLPLL